MQCAKVLSVVALSLLFESIAGAQSFVPYATPGAQNYAPYPTVGATQSPTGFAPYRPVVPDPFGPYNLVGGYARAALTAHQPTGHEIIPLGPNGYVYRPTYDGTPPAQLNPLAASYGLYGIGPQWPAGVSGAVYPPGVVAHPQPGEPQLYDQAVDEFRAGRYDAALATVNQLVSAQPQNGAAFELQSHCNFALGKYNDAAQSLRKTIALSSAVSWTEMVKNYRRYYLATRYTEHLARLEKRVIDQPNDLACQLLLGYHAGGLGFRNEAAAHLRQAQQLAPADETVRVLLDQWDVGTNAIPAPPQPVVQPRPVGPVVF